MCVWLRSSCICSGQSGRKTPIYQQWSSIYYQGIIQSGQHQYRQPKSNPGRTPLEQPYPYPGSGWTVLSIHKMLFTAPMGFTFRHLRHHFFVIEFLQPTELIIWQSFINNVFFRLMLVNWILYIFDIFVNELIVC